MSKLLTIKCGNPNCQNTFPLYPSELGRKLYCCGKCGSEHHWMITPLFEKKCINPACNVIIKRKFQQQIDKINYCSSKCRHDHKNTLFVESLNDTIKSRCRVCKTELTTKREPCGKLIPRKICDECNKKESREKTAKMTEKFLILMKTDEGFKRKMKKIFDANNKHLRAWMKIPENLKKWRMGCSKAFENGKSKIEDKAADYIKSKISKIERSYPISNMFVDIYVPEKNLVVECLGDYWHMTPQKYSPDDYNKSTKRTAKEQWDKDRRRKLFMESKGYRVVELWESEINRGDYQKIDIYI